MPTTATPKEAPTMTTPSGHMSYDEAVALAGQIASGALRPTKQQKVEAAWARLLGPEGYTRRIARAAR